MRSHPLRLLLVLVTGAALLGTPTVPGLAADKLDEARDRREAIEADFTRITSELERTSVRIADARETRERLASDVEALAAEAAAAEELLGARAVEAYVHGTTGVMDMLLASDGPGHAMQRARLLETMSRRERMAIERATAARGSLHQRQAELDQLIVDLAGAEERLSALQRELEAAFRAARAHEADLASRRQRQREVSRGMQRGLYACPIARPFHFRDTWGAPRSGGRRHKGVDIFGPMGADVYAITNGVIARHSSSGLGGIGLYLRGDDGHLYYYAHLQGILPGYGPGRRVEAGERIATNGSSGNASIGAPHIHMEVRPGGGATVNPYPFAAAACH